MLFFGNAVATEPLAKPLGFLATSSAVRSDAPARACAGRASLLSSDESSASAQARRRAGGSGGGGLGFAFAAVEMLWVNILLTLSISFANVSSRLSSH